jgi:hypothetical protein
LYASWDLSFGKAVDAQVAFWDYVFCQVRLDDPERAGSGARRTADAFEIASKHYAVIHFFHRFIRAGGGAGGLVAM